MRNLEELTLMVEKRLIECTPGGVKTGSVKLKVERVNRMASSSPHRFRLGGARWAPSLEGAIRNWLGGDQDVTR